MKVSVKTLCALEDNYIYLLSFGQTALVVDPAEAEPVFRFLEEEGLKLERILVTHHHLDHVGGCEALKYDSKCSLIGPDDDRIPGLDEIVHEGEELSIGPLQIRILSIPGHTSTHVAYYLPKQGWLFCGDCLFGAGCGRLFEGSAEEMLGSLRKIASLPDETKLFFGHEYTLKNLRFAETLEPNNPDLKRRLKEAEELEQKGLPTTPSTLAEEKRSNPFLRVGEGAFRQALGREGVSDVELFAEIRARRDKF